MAIAINHKLTAQSLVPKIGRLFEVSAGKILNLEKTWRPAQGTPVFTARGKYTTRGWTEWTQGFQYGSALLQFDATGDQQFLDLGQRQTFERMATHVSHIGVHDHGFNNLSTYGNLWRLAREGRIPANEPERAFYELALKVSGAVQAARWTPTTEGRGYIYSFNGPHSLFVDTMRSLRSLAVAHQLGHVLMGERDQRISLLQRLVDHAETTARYNIYYGEGRDAYDVPGRTAHESIFNPHDGTYRCPNSQQGYSAFSTWTRGLAWAILGFAEQLEFFAEGASRHHYPFSPSPQPSPPRRGRGRIIASASARLAHQPCPTRGVRGSLSPAEGERVGVRGKEGGRETGDCVQTHPFAHARFSTGGLSPRAVRSAVETMLRAATAAAEFYLAQSCADGVPMWDTGAPNLHRLGDCLNRPADPFNAWEPVDSSAAVIAAQGLVRLGNYLVRAGDKRKGARYRQAGLTVANALFDEPYLSTSPKHQGLLLHSVYHRPNGWDYVAPGQKVPNGESSMWGDYHARELALLLLRETRGERYLTFFDPEAKHH